MAIEPERRGGEGSCGRAKSTVDEEEVRAKDSDGSLTDGKGRYEEYQSLSRFFTADSALVEEGGSEGFLQYDNVELNEERNLKTLKRKKKSRSTSSSSSSSAPPWRRYIGRIFLQLESPIAEYTPEDEWDIYVDILDSTFKGFSDVPVGSDIEVIDLARPAEIQGDLTFEVDTRPDLVGLEDGGGDVLYDEPLRAVEEDRSKPTSTATCWNCLSPGHAYTSCPEPKNHMIIRHAREAHLFQRDFVMPEHARPALDTYLSMNVTHEEKDRRLELVDKFQAGRISQELEDAICHFDEDAIEDDSQMDLIRQQIEVKRRRKRWDWYDRIMRWGYPPGWIAVKGEPAKTFSLEAKLVEVEAEAEARSDPIEESRRRIEALQIHEKAFELDLEGDADELQVIGGTLGTPRSSIVDSDSSPSGSESDSGSETSSLLTPSLDNGKRTGERKSSSGDNAKIYTDADMHAAPVQENEKLKPGYPSSPTSRPLVPPISPHRPDEQLKSASNPPPPPPVDMSPPPPPSEEDGAPPPPPPPAEAYPAPPSLISHPNPFLQRHYELQAQIEARARNSHSHRTVIATPPTAPRGHPRQLPATPASLGADRSRPVDQAPAFPHKPPSTLRSAMGHLIEEYGSGAMTPPSMPWNETEGKARRWVKFHTDLFASDRLAPFSEARPFPLGHY
uniref:CCHC-type domain-containing protein n=1 Tax=Kwoniella dejecticola CBS 10117 TaxID=1296121 RepID=A0A1A6A5K0_9TREE|nr:uncharacterized protein I303_04669 [Kwoniella dejecticola CBS 10117]OBR85334.1 hypothetical protein I303_04669 [Kwoniella dejecticola CBS 10117]